MAWQCGRAYAQDLRDRVFAAPRCGSPIKIDGPIGCQTEMGQKAVSCIWQQAGLALKQDSGLGHGFDYACGAGVRGVADGHRSKKSSAYADRAFRLRYAIRQR